MNDIRLLRVPPKKILVPMDATEASIIAWKQAQRLAERFGAQVQGLYVQEWMYYTEPYYEAIDKRVTMDCLRSKLGTDADIRPADGPIEETILSWGRHLDFDLIVMGTHGRTGLERAIKGSIAEHIVRRSAVPVLVARQATPRFRRILAPLNFEPYAMEGLFFAARLAETLKAHLTVLHVQDSPIYSGAGAADGPKRLLADFIARLPQPLRDACHPKPLLAFGKPADEIVAAADQADIVVLAAHRKGFLHDALLGTTAERVLRHCHKAVLAVPVSSPARRTMRSAQGRSRHELTGTLD